MKGRVIRGSEAPLRVISCDVAIVGSGAGGSIAAARLAARGAKVVIVEEGAYLTRNDFEPLEHVAYPAMYQDAGSRATEDLGIVILQGKTVGGGTTVNWMTSLRTPESTLEAWRTHHAVEAIDNSTLAPLWDSIEQRLSVRVASLDDVNASNRILLDGATKLGWSADLLPRNADERCTNLGVCGMGCPVDGKRSATLTYLSDAIESGATLLTETKAVRLTRGGDSISGLECEAKRMGLSPVAITIRAKSYVLAGGAINSPALLIRSGLGSGPVGLRTWLHPVVAIAAVFDGVMSPWEGSPQSIGSHQFAQRGERMGFFIETPPIHPMLAALSVPAFGEVHRDFVSLLPNLTAMIGLCIDGFHRDEPGGTVVVERSGRIRLRYPFTDRFREAAREAMLAMASIALEAGARRALTFHSNPLEIRSAADFPKLASSRFDPLDLSVFSAHQMGGCAMGEDTRRAVVNSKGRHHQLRNLHIADGSLFPTGLGVNPMLTIYGVAALVADAIELNAEPLRRARS